MHITDPHTVSESNSLNEKKIRAGNRFPPFRVNINRNDDSKAKPINDLCQRITIRKKYDSTIALVLSFLCDIPHTYNSSFNLSNVKKNLI